MKEINISQIIGFMEIADELYDNTNGKVSMVVEKWARGDVKVSIFASEQGYKHAFIYGRHNMKAYSSDDITYHDNLFEFTVDVNSAVAKVSTCEALDPCEDCEFTGTHECDEKPRCVR